MSLFGRNSGTYIVYNSHVTCSNSSFLLTMVMPTSPFFAFHWLCCLFPIGYLPKTGYMGVRIATITEFNHAHCSGDFPISSTDAPVFNITTVGMVRFRQSPCWYYIWADVVLSTSSDTQDTWTWWHFGDHTGLINLSVNNIRRIHTCRSRYYITQWRTRENCSDKVAERAVNEISRGRNKYMRMWNIANEKNGNKVERSRCDPWWTTLSSICDSSPALVGPSGICAGWGMEINGRFEAERLRLGHLRLSELQHWHLFPLCVKFITRPCCLV